MSLWSIWAALPGGPTVLSPAGELLDNLYELALAELGEVKPAKKLIKVGDRWMYSMVITGWKA